MDIQTGILTDQMAYLLNAKYMQVGVYIFVW